MPNLSSLSHHGEKKTETIGWPHLPPPSSENEVSCKSERQKQSQSVLTNQACLDYHNRFSATQINKVHCATLSEMKDHSKHVGIRWFFSLLHDHAHVVVLLAEWMFFDAMAREGREGKEWRENEVTVCFLMTIMNK